MEFERVLQKLHSRDRDAIRHELTDSVHPVEAFARVLKQEKSGKVSQDYGKGSRDGVMKIVFFKPSILLALKRSARSSAKLKKKSSKREVGGEDDAKGMKERAALVVRFSEPGIVLQAAQTDATGMTGTSTLVLRIKRKKGHPTQLIRLEFRDAANEPSATLCDEWHAMLGEAVEFWKTRWSAQDRSDVGDTRPRSSTLPSPQALKSLLSSSSSGSSSSVSDLDDFRDSPGRKSSVSKRLASSVSPARLPGRRRKHTISSVSTIPRPALTADAVQTETVDGEEWIVMATIEKLVELACGVYGDVDGAVRVGASTPFRLPHGFMNALMLSYREYISPSELFEKFPRFLDTYSGVACVRRHTVPFLIAWIEAYPADFCSALRDRVRTFVQECSIERLGSDDVQSVMAALAKAEEFSQFQSRRVETLKSGHRGVARLSGHLLSSDSLDEDDAAAWRDCVTHADGNEQKSALMRPQPRDVAEQISLIVRSHIAKIDVQEILPGTVADSTVGVTDFTRQLHDAISHAVHNASSRVERISEIAYWVDVAFYLTHVPVTDAPEDGSTPKVLLDFTACDAVESSLRFLKEQPEIARILPPDTQRRWHTVRDAVEHVGQLLREQSVYWQPPFAGGVLLFRTMQFLPPLTAWSEHIMELNMRLPDLGELVSVARLMQLYWRISDIRRMQDRAANIAEKPHVVAWLNSLPLPDTHNSLKGIDFWPEMTRSHVALSNMVKILHHLMVEPRPDDEQALRDALDRMLIADTKKFITWHQWEYINQWNASSLCVHGGGCFFDFKDPPQFKEVVQSRHLVNRSEQLVSFRFHPSAVDSGMLSSGALRIEPRCAKVPRGGRVKVNFTFNSRSPDSVLEHCWLEVQHESALDGETEERVASDDDVRYRYAVVVKAEPLTFGDRLERFDGNEIHRITEHGKLLAVGGEGRLYLCRWNEQDVVLKRYGTVADPDAPDGWMFLEGGMESFRREVEAFDDLCAIIDSDELVAALGFCCSPPAVMLEYVPGGSLASVIDDSEELDEQQLSGACLGILKGLAVLHQHGFIHRDLKPDNVLIVAREPIRVKLCDLGTSYRACETEFQTNAGTVGFSAPEVILHDPYYIKKFGKSPEPYTESVDMWSFGMCIRALYTRRASPYHDISINHNSQIEEAILEGRPPELDGITNEFWHSAAIACCSFAPDMRPSAVGLLRTALAHFV